MSALLDFQEYTILIVDDDPIISDAVTGYLEGFGFKIEVTLESESALEKVRQIWPDLILLDVMMPDIDGFEVCCQLKADQATKDIPVIFMTSLTDVDDIVRGFEVGGGDYITKPIQYKELLARVTNHLKIRHLTQSLQEQANELQQTNEALLKVTDDLQEANFALSKRAIQLEACNQVGQQVTSILNLDELLTNVVESIQSKFGYYFVGIWLLNEQQNRVVLQAGVKREPGQSVAPGLSVASDAEQSAIAWVCQNREAYLSDNVERDPKYLSLEGLPLTRSELTLPLQIGEEMIGVLGIHSDHLAAFDSEDKRVLQTLANQITIAIRNAWLYELQQKLHRLEEERANALAKLNADKDKFFSIISHDLRSPFNILLGNAKLLVRGIDSFSKQDLKEISQGIYNGAEAVHSLLENLLTWSRMQRKGGIEYKPEQIEMSALAQETMNLLKQAAVEKKIGLRNTIEKGLSVYADKDMIEMVLRNLTGNALKFTPRGGTVTLAAKIRNNHGNGQTRQSRPHFVEVAVKDTGVGMSQEDIARLFRIDVHHSTLGTEKEQGTGLGLIICKEMVEQNGGQIWVESKPGKGTTVGFTVPQTTLSSANMGL
jgi:signal transduction histidine kinase/DNA-binding response OmpR family regulator